MSSTDDKVFLNNLMSETYSHLGDIQDEANEDNVCLLKHFEERKKKSVPQNLDPVFWGYLERNHLGRLDKVCYRNEINCFELKTDDEVLHFPENWSLFKNLKTALDNEQCMFFEIGAETEKELAEILCRLHKKELTYYFFIHKGSLGVFGTTESSNRLVEGFKSFFEASPADAELKAA